MLHSSVAVQRIASIAGAQVPAILQALSTGITVDYSVRIDTIALAIAIVVAAMRFHRDWLQMTSAVNQMYADYCERKGIPFQPIAGGDVRMVMRARAGSGKNISQD